MIDSCFDMIEILRVHNLLGTPDTSFSGLKTLTALNVLRSKPLLPPPLAKMVMNLERQSIIFIEGDVQSTNRNLLRDQIHRHIWGQMKFSYLKNLLFARQAKNRFVEMDIFQHFLVVVTVGFKNNNNNYCGTIIICVYMGGLGNEWMIRWTNKMDKCIENGWMFGLMNHPLFGEF